MRKTAHKLENLIEKGLEYILQSSEFEWAQRPSPKKWSKKEILGHLIDSGINNLQRFTEIQSEVKPYKIRPYNQNQLVKANNYQDAELKEIIDFWVSINSRICFIITQQTEETLDYKIETNDGEISDLRFLIKDYVDHLEHHLNQVIRGL